MWCGKKRRGKVSGGDREAAAEICPTKRGIGGSASVAKSREMTGARRGIGEQQGQLQLSSDRRPGSTTRGGGAHTEGCDGCRERALAVLELGGSRSSLGGESGGARARGRLESRFGGERGGSLARRWSKKRGRHPERDRIFVRNHSSELRRFRTCAVGFTTSRPL